MFRMFKAFVNGRNEYQQDSYDALNAFEKSLRQPMDNPNTCMASSRYLESRITESDWYIIKVFVDKYKIKANITLNQGSSLETTQILNTETPFSNEWFICFERSSKQCIKNLIVSHLNDILPEGPSPSGHYYQ